MRTRPGDPLLGRPYVSTTEVAAAFGVERQTVARWIRTGKLRAIRIKVGQRSTYRIEVAEVRAFARRYIEQL